MVGSGAAVGDSEGVGGTEAAMVGVGSGVGVGLVGVGVAGNSLGVDW